jgi:hypothetical protein
MKNQREPIFSLTAKDFRWDYYVGSGKGGQKKNKTANCVRCTHEESKVSATGESGRSQHDNKKLAFSKVVRDPEFCKWLRIETARRCGEQEVINKRVRQSMADHNLKVEYKENGKWVKHHD